ncbi:MAG: chemotaxis protein CheX [Myxococcota bacterium]
MNSDLERQIQNLVATLCETLFGDNVRVELAQASNDADLLWGRITIAADHPIQLWVGTSRHFITRVTRRLLASRHVSDSDLEDATRELTNIIAGNLKTLIAPDANMGIPELTQPPPRATQSRAVTLSIDSDTLGVIIESAA